MEELGFRLVSEARRRPDASAAQLAPCWPEICDALVAFQRRKGVNMNLEVPFQAQGYFPGFPADRAARD
jgi:hypothetical protein